jgi:hypothetical protein
MWCPSWSQYAAPEAEGAASFLPRSSVGGLAAQLPEPPRFHCLLMSVKSLACFCRHGCTPYPPLLIVTWSGNRLPHLAQRNRRSFSGTSPRPTSMIACGSAGAVGGRTGTRRTGRASHPARQHGAGSREIVGRAHRPKKIRTSTSTANVSSRSIRTSASVN